MKQVSLLKVVVASPGDVKPERDCLAVVADELNRGVGDLLGVHLDVVRWETDAFPGFHGDGSQAQIDRALKVPESELLIGIFWKRFGTPVPGAASGTEHEIRGAYRSWQQTGRPQIMVYFNTRKPAELPPEEEAQWAAVRAFQADPMFQQGLWWSFADTAEFERLARRHLTQYLKHRVTPLEGDLRTVETPLGTMDVSQPSPGRARSLAEIAPGLQRYHSREFGFEIGWPPAGWQAITDPFQLMNLQAQMGLNPMLTPNLRLLVVLYHVSPIAGFAPNVNLLAEQVGPLTIRDYLARSVYQMRAAGLSVVSAEADDASQSGVVVFFGRDPVGRPLFQFQRLLLTNGVCLIATASQLPPLDQMGENLRTELAGILNSLQRA